MTVIVSDNPEQNRFEIHVDGQLAGFGEYRLNGDRIAFTHTEIPAEYNGRGLGRQLVAEQLAEARRRELSVLPVCPYVRKVIARDPEAYLDLVPVAERSKFDLPVVVEGAASTSTA